MNDSQLPALYQVSDSLALKAQKFFFLILKSHLFFLVIGAALSFIPVEHRYWALLQFAILVLALMCSIALAFYRPEQKWFRARATAESVKTISWRYACRAEPFNASDLEASRTFGEKLQDILQQNHSLSDRLLKKPELRHITPEMRKIRGASLDDRKIYYDDKRICDQLDWYQKKARHNKRKARYFISVLISANLMAVLFAWLRYSYGGTLWPIDISLTIAASLLTWWQAKRFSELAATYSLAAIEIGIIRESALLPHDEASFSDFVLDSEAAFSREHTQWVARRSL